MFCSPVLRCVVSCACLDDVINLHSMDSRDSMERKNQYSGSWVEMAKQREADVVSKVYLEYLVVKKVG